MKTNYSFSILLISLLSLNLISCVKSDNASNGITTIVTVIPIAPTNLIGTQETYDKLILKWTDNSTNEVGFKIERKLTSGNYTIIGSVDANITNYVDSGISPNTSYTYRVYAYNPVGNSLQYSNEVNITTKTFFVTIGKQIWTNKNLDLSTYRNGDIIPQVTDAKIFADLTTGAWCYYNNDSTNYSKYGKLYNWYAITDVRGLAPKGWHIPSATEWETLATFLRGAGVAGGQMKESGTLNWSKPNTDATNTSGFSGLPGGRKGYNNFSDEGYIGYFWSSSIWCGNGWCIGPISRSLNYSDGSLSQSSSPAMYLAFSVRCIKD